MLAEIILIQKRYMIADRHFTTKATQQSVIKTPVDTCSTYVHSAQQDATIVPCFYCKITLHVSCNLRAHHQE
jgi:hypothetical protein